MKPAPEDVERLRMEHEAMSSTLCEVENHVSQDTMKHLRRYYAEQIMDARDFPPRS